MYVLEARIEMIPSREFHSFCFSDISAAFIPLRAFELRLIALSESQAPSAPKPIRTVALRCVDITAKQLILITGDGLSCRRHD